MRRPILIVTLALLSMSAAPPPSEDPARATLLQLSLAISDPAKAADLRTAMVEETALITSCANAFDVGKRLQARGLHGTLNVAVKTNVTLASLPQPLRTALLTRPVGRATPVYGGADALRVLVRCEPGFRIPGKIAPSPKPNEKPVAI